MGNEEPDAEMVECPACEGHGRRPLYGGYPKYGACPECKGACQIAAARAYDLSIAAAEQREMSADDEAHAWRERMQERDL